MRISRIILMGSAALLAVAAPLGAQTQSASPKGSHTGDLAGVWYPSSVNTFNFVWTDAQGKNLSVLPLTPLGQERIKGNHPIGGEYTALTSNDPNSKCLPPGVPNIYTHAYPVEVLQVPGRTILYYEYMHIVRQIFTDGRKHQEDAIPTWMGDSTGRWDGGTLVVDSTGFNDKSWLDVSGHPHSEALHVVERMYRPDHNTLMIDITVDDPQTYTATLKTQRKYILKPDWNIMEYVCEDTREKFDEFEKKVGVKGTQTAQAAQQSGSSASITGDWKGTIKLADGRSFPASISFTAESSGSLTVADPSAAMNYQFRSVSVAEGGVVTGNTSDQVNFLGQLSADGKQMTGDIILPTGTGHKISLTRQ